MTGWTQRRKQRNRWKDEQQVRMMKDTWKCLDSFRWKQNFEDLMNEEHVREELTVAALEATLQKFFAVADKKANECFERLESQLGAINETLVRHSQQLQVQQKITTSLQEQMKAAEATTARHDETLKQLQDKMTSMEDRMRRDNLRIVNVKEGEEQGNVLAYLKRNLLKWFPELAGNPPELMRAHRSGPPRKTSERPRTIILKCLRFTDRDRILQSARKTEVRSECNIISFTPDYSDATAQRMRLCYPVMAQARSLGFHAFLLYPAVIKLTRVLDFKDFRDFYLPGTRFGKMVELQRTCTGAALHISVGHPSSSSDFQS
uniref:L1 transposable element RRM domain-containing protein n=1 Tax=Oryzias latipes TaxID=8090 RepID=A0A3P9K262_ORYLA